MPTQVQGFSAEEERALEEMRQKSLKQLELLRVRQVQYKTQYAGSFQGSTKDTQNTGSSFVMRSNLNVETQNGNSSANHRQQLPIGQAERSGVLNESGLLSKAGKDSETRTTAESTIEQNLPFSRNLENISHFSRSRQIEEPNSAASAAFGKNHDVQNVMDISLKEAKSFMSSGDADSLYNHSYKGRVHYDWGTHVGGGDSQEDDFYPKTSHADFAKRPTSADRRDVYEDGLEEELRHHPRIETELSDSDGDSATDVITITDSPLDRTLNARSKMAAISKNSSRNGGFDETSSARDLESDTRTSPTAGVYSHDAWGLRHIREGFDTKKGSVSPPRQTSSAEGTPKSILRHRRIIDENVKVESKYEHTPTTSRSRRRRGLNFSYSDVIDSDSAVLRSKSVNFSDSVESSDQQEQENKRPSKSKSSPEKSKTKTVETTLRSHQLTQPVSDASKKPSQKLAMLNDARSHSKRPHYVSPTDGSYTEERDLDKNETRNDQRIGSRAEKKGIRVENEGAKDREVSKHLEQSGHQSDKVKEVVQKNLLLHSGNDRKHASIVRELESRPKSVVFDAKKGKETKVKKFCINNYVYFIVCFHCLIVLIPMESV